MFRNKSVSSHQFSMIPRADIPRSSFRQESAHKTTFDAGYLVPVYLNEVLPGDTFNVHMTAFARMSTPFFPLMDNLYLDSFFFFVPNRLLWTNWVKFQGEQANPADSISYVVPQQVSPVGGYAINSLQDYMGLPTVGQVGGAATVSHCAFWPRAYNLIYNTWFRDENLQNAAVVDLGDGPDASPSTNYILRRRGKRHDYFTSCLPWPQKGSTAVTLPLGTSAPVFIDNTATAGTNTIGVLYKGATNAIKAMGTAGAALVDATGAYTAGYDLRADLSAATAATINQIREAFQIQKLLERDARGGTRYTEIVRSHFGVSSPDARLQRPEYIGGGTTPINIHSVSQTSATDVTGSTTSMGSLAAFATAVAQNSFTYSATEHGVILGMVSVRADLTYQQGMHRMWSRSTRYDFYMPVLAHLGEQSVLNKEIYCDGSANDVAIFGFQERWAEYRYKPSMITGQFRSTMAGALDQWHAAQDFATLPTLNTTFIQDTPPMERILALGSQAAGQQFLFDSVFVGTLARPMPLYSVPGLIDHF